MVWYLGSSMPDVVKLMLLHWLYTCNDLQVYHHIWCFDAFFVMCDIQVHQHPRCCWCCPQTPWCQGQEHSQNWSVSVTTGSFSWSFPSFCPWPHIVFMLSAFRCIPLFSIGMRLDFSWRMHALLWFEVFCSGWWDCGCLHDRAYI